MYGHPDHILFDEIQNFPCWELLVNRLQRTGRRLLLTGSNASLLESEVGHAHYRATTHHAELKCKFLDYCGLTPPSPDFTACLKALKG